MPLISVVGRKSAPVRLLTAAIYAIVVAGAVTMVYPFLLMVSGSFKTDVDKDDWDVVPAFVHDDLTLYRKVLECRYNNRPTLYNAANRIKAYEFRTADPPPALRPARIADWKAYEARADLPPRTYHLGWTEHFGDRLRLWKHREFRAHLMDLCGGDIEVFNRRFDTQQESWISVGLFVERLTERRYQLAGNALEDEFYRFKADQPRWFRVYPSLDGVYVQNYLEAIYGREADGYNRLHATDVGSLRELVLRRTVPPVRPRPSWTSRVDLPADAALAAEVVAEALQPPAGPPRGLAGELWRACAGPFRRRVTGPVRQWAGQRLQRKDWEWFVREELNLQYVRIRQAARGLFADFLRKRYSDAREPDATRRAAKALATLNERYGADYAAFEDVPYPEELIRASDRLVDWAEFVKTVPAEHIELASPEIGFRDFLADKYDGDLEALRRAHGVGGAAGGAPETRPAEAADARERTARQYASFDTVPMPTREVDYDDFLAHRGEIKREFLTSNYRQVGDYIILHGRSLLNTTIYCALAILASLTVNPLAAYALSRYGLPSTYKILLFCMATMAFPAAVTMIPNFLLLKELNLLNTFAALVLPGMANGFSIFLLKGFFDSLPRELYESAQLDGASEWVMFWNLSMALSKPILAVLALNAFTRAYGNFMFAFILCPDEKMWTLMVFLYQLQIDGHMGLTFAALLVAAVPTFVVFVFCQNIIIRGIVVPVEK